MTTKSDTLEKVDPVGLPNLTRLSWNQPLVSSIRLRIYADDIPVVHPVHKTDSVAYTDDELKILSKREFDRFDGVEAYAFEDASRQIVFSADVTPAHNIIDSIATRAAYVRSLFTDSARGGAILAVIFTELGWPVHGVAQVLNTSRPTLNRWILMSQEKPITEDEIELLRGDSALISSNFSWLIDIRTQAFKSRRTGLVWKKAVFFPDAEIVASMKALWRIAYRVRGDKSGYQETVCAATLDIMIELLLRRGVTAQNIGRMLGIQHMAVLQRNRKSKDVYGDVQTKMGFEYGIIPFARTVPGDPLAFTTVTQDRKYDPEDPSTPAFLLQARTNIPTESHPLPPANLSVLCYRDTDEREKLEELDELPLYAVNDHIDSAPGRYAVSVPNLHGDSQRATAAYLLSGIAEGASPFQYRTLSPLSNSGITALGYDSLKYGYPDILPPDKWRDGRLYGEALLLQATMQYDRNRYGENFGTTTYHWVPGEVLDGVIKVVPETESKEYLEEMTALEPSSQNLLERLDDFFPLKHANMIVTWIDESDKRTENGEKSLLFKCLNQPGEIVRSFAPPAPRGRIEDGS